MGRGRGIFSDFSRVFLGRKGIFGRILARRWNLEGRFGAPGAAGEGAARPGELKLAHRTRTVKLCTK